MSTTDEYSYPASQYSIPNRTHGFNPLGPPLPDSRNPNVVRFTASKADIRSSSVIDHTGMLLYQFKSTGGRHLEMFDTDDTLIARFEEGNVFYGDNFPPVKGKKFIRYGTPGNTGAVLTYGEQRYEFVQEIFYAIVRTTPASDRVAIVYNYTGRPAVEMVSGVPEVPGLQEYIVFVTALQESGVMKKASSESKAIRKIIPPKFVKTKA